MSEPLKLQRLVEPVGLDVPSSADSAGLCGSHSEQDWPCPLGADIPVWWTDPDRHPNVMKRMIAGCALRAEVEALGITRTYNCMQVAQEGFPEEVMFKKMCEG